MVTVVRHNDVMSNSVAEPMLDEPDAVRTTQLAVPPSGTKKKSGFVITSVTDSGHGRPSSIVRDGEESADDLDESHTSYSDISYSKTTDADHDQESTASEDTLNISAHESVTSTDGAVTNHISIPSLSHSPMQLHVNQHNHPEGTHITKSASTNDSNPPQTSNNHQTSASGQGGGGLVKQHSEHLDSPQELPHDNTISEPSKVEKSKEREKQTENTNIVGATTDEKTKTKVIKGSMNSSEQNHDISSTASGTHTAPAPVSSTVAVTTSTEVTATSTQDRPSVVTTVTITTTAGSAKTPPVTTSVTSSSKVGGTRVYKVVKRDTYQPTKRSRGRWIIYDFSDNQSATIGMISHSSSDSKLLQDLPPYHPIGFNASTTVGPYQLQQSDSSNSVFKEQLMRSGFPSNNSFSSSTSSLNWDVEMKKQYASYMSMKNEDRDVTNITPDALKSAMKKYAAKTAGDVSTGDISSSSRSLKIDNKIEAAMDLVKKHLMSAVRDEVDELKEKIKELQDENSRLKTENQALRTPAPTEVQSQLQASLPPTRRDASTKDKKMSFDNQTSTVSVSTVSSVDNLHQQGQQSTGTQEHLLQKGLSMLTSQGSATIPQMQQAAVHSNDSKGKPVATSTGITQSQRQDVSKLSKANPPVNQQQHLVSSSSSLHTLQATTKMQNPTQKLTAGQPHKPATVSQSSRPLAAQNQPVSHTNDHQRSDQGKEVPPASKTAQTNAKESNFLKKNAS